MPPLTLSICMVCSGTALLYRQLTERYTIILLRLKIFWLTEKSIGFLEQEVASCRLYDNRQQSDTGPSSVEFRLHIR
jgi:hypothetical protein